MQLLHLSDLRQGKTYTQTLTDRIWTQLDSDVLVHHKRAWKILPRKDLGQKMKLIGIAKREKYTIDELNFLPSTLSIQGILDWHQGWDEDTEKKYTYIHGMTHQQAQEKIKHINTIYNTGYRVTEKDNITMLSSDTQTAQKEENNKELQYLFALMLLYGKWESKDTVLHGIKIQVPLITSTMQHQEEIKERVKSLQEDDFLIQHDSLPSSSGSTEQIVSKDPELLDIFSHAYKSIENWETISTYDIASHLHAEAIAYLEENNLVEQKNILQRSHYKVLTKT